MQYTHAGLMTFPLRTKSFLRLVKSLNIVQTINDVVLVLSKLLTIISNTKHLQQNLILTTEIKISGISLLKNINSCS